MERLPGLPVMVAVQSSSKRIGEKKHFILCVWLGFEISQKTQYRL
jgi:hypothetical protein